MCLLRVTRFCVLTLLNEIVKDFSENINKFFRENITQKNVKLEVCQFLFSIPRFFNLSLGSSLIMLGFKAP